MYIDGIYINIPDIYIYIYKEFEVNISMRVCDRLLFLRVLFFQEKTILRIRGKTLVVKVEH